MRDASCGMQDARCKMTDVTFAGLAKGALHISWLICFEGSILHKPH